MTLNEQVWCRVGVSSIHGVGVFAIRDIPQGQKLYCNDLERELIHVDLDTLLPEVRDLVVSYMPIALEGELIVSPNQVVHLLSLMNHSDTPNYDNATDRALRAIHRGEEITEDYGRFAQLLTKRVV